MSGEEIYTAKRHRNPETSKDGYVAWRGASVAVANSHKHTEISDLALKYCFPSNQVEPTSQLANQSTKQTNIKNTPSQGKEKALRVLGEGTDFRIRTGKGKMGLYYIKLKNKVQW